MKYKKYCKSKGGFEAKLAEFDKLIQDIKDHERDADDYRDVFKNSYKNLLDSFKEQRDMVASQIGRKIKRPRAA